ncbi:FkbM family methyltransferase [Salegentibacter sp. JZCK2]|uniref:FkbM family methyltransferase n=1 Tax=Salegentibacter tibetensis TaxID=2873600 RepID=UPI001CCEFE76|nr:FkbM family methyltransferase [Salegentibacter tibetensis]MBZ9729754.1 FkbM family methyltransferase [Salegentibacter tibetensis]
MNKFQKKIISRVIQRIYKHFPNDRFRLFLTNLSAKLISKNNSVEYDSKENLYWLKAGNKFLFAVETPYFDFHRKKMDSVYEDIFCCHYKPKEGDTIVDVGAGIGTELNYFVELIQGMGKFYGIEASPKCYNKLELLSKKNGYDNVYNYNIALSGINGVLWIEEQENYRISQINNNSKGVEIPSYTLDRFVSENQISQIHFLKVNIEGAEFDIIDGMKNSIQIIENVAISCHDFLFSNGNYRIRSKVSKFLMTNNFEIYRKESGNEIMDSWIYGKRKK